MDPARDLFQGIVDYAGLFPPTGASMNMASPKLRNRKPREIASSYTAFQPGPRIAATSTISVVPGAWKLVMSASTTRRR